MRETLVPLSAGSLSHASLSHCTRTFYHGRGRGCGAAGRERRCSLALGVCRTKIALCDNLTGHFWVPQRVHHVLHVSCVFLLMNVSVCIGELEHSNQSFGSQNLAVFKTLSYFVITCSPALPTVDIPGFPILSNDAFIHGSSSWKSYVTELQYIHRGPISTIVYSRNFAWL